MRFHGMVRTEFPARHVVEAGGVDRFALICRHDGRVVAVASYDRLREPGAAEVSFAVADEFRRRWTATRRERIDERDHRSAVASLRSVIAPGSVAIVGARDAPEDPGGAVLSNVIDGHFRGVVTAINAAGGVIRSSRAALSIAGLGEAPELVVIAVPAEEVVEVAREAAARGSKALVDLRGAIADEGDQAHEREERLLEVVRGAGMRLVGPNCLGVLNTDPEVSLNATFAGFRVPAGRRAICSESGAIGTSLLGHSAARRLGISSFASLGRRVDVSTKRPA